MNLGVFSQLPVIHILIGLFFLPIIWYVKYLWREIFFLCEYSSEENCFPVLERAKSKMKWILESAEPRWGSSWVEMELCKTSGQQRPLLSFMREMLWFTHSWELGHEPLMNVLYM